MRHELRDLFVCKHRARLAVFLDVPHLRAWAPGITITTALVVTCFASVFFRKLR